MFEGPNTTTKGDQIVDPSVDSTGAVDDGVDGLFVELLDSFVGVPPVELNAAVGELELRRRALDAETAAAIHVAEMSGCVLG